MELHLYPQQKQIAACGVPPGLSVAPAMENYTQFPLEGIGASLRAQPDRLHPAAGHGLLQELVVPR